MVDARRERNESGTPEPAPLPKRRECDHAVEEPEQDRRFGQGSGAPRPNVVSLPLTHEQAKVTANVSRAPDAEQSTAPTADRSASGFTKDRAPRRCRSATDPLLVLASQGQEQKPSSRGPLGDEDVLCQTGEGFGLGMTVGAAIRWVAWGSGRGPDELGIVTVMCCCRPVWRLGL